VSQLKEFDGHKLESVSKKGLELEEVDDEKTVPSTSPAPSDQTPAHRGGYDERVELPGRNHDDLADDLRVVCHPRQATEREHIAAGTKNTRSSQGAAAMTTSRGDLCVVRHPRRATEREHIAAGTKNARSSQGAAATTTSRRPV
jgi:hypothetical protein